MPSMTILKLDAARSQLDMAIELWFRGGHDIAVHTLASAAYEIIHDIHVAKKTNVELLYNADLIKSEYHGKWVKLLRKTANFFKHANNDPEGVIQYEPKEALAYMMFATRGLTFLAGRGTAHSDALAIWLAINQPDWIKTSFVKIIEDSLPIKGIDFLRKFPKGEFLEVFLDIRRKGEATG